jgi:hypothetical protein
MTILPKGICKIQCNSHQYTNNFLCGNGKKKFQDSQKPKRIAKEIPEQIKSSGGGSTIPDFKT